jgi:hypothetical protein
MIISFTENGWEDSIKVDKENGKNQFAHQRYQPVLQVLSRRFIVDLRIFFGHV